MKLALLHPGQMGVTIGIAAKDSGHSVSWLRAGRSDETVARAGAAGFSSCKTLPDLLARTEGVAVIFDTNRNVR